MLFLSLEKLLTMFMKNYKNGCAAVAGFYFNCSIMPVGDAVTNRQPRPVPLSFV